MATPKLAPDWTPRHKGGSKRISKDRLHQQSGRAESRPTEQRGENLWQTKIEDDLTVHGIGIAMAEQSLQHLAQREVHTTQADAQ